MNVNKRKCVYLCACGALHPINAFGFICVYWRSFAENSFFFKPPENPFLFHPVVVQIALPGVVECDPLHHSHNMRFG